MYGGARRKIVTYIYIYIKYVMKGCFHYITGNILATNYYKMCNIIGIYEKIRDQLHD